MASDPLPDDELVRTLSKDGSASVMAVVATQLVRDAIAVRSTSKTAGSALGRAMMGALLMAASKQSGETVQIQLRGKGPLGSVTAISDADLRVRGTVAHRDIEVPAREDGRPDLKSALGSGVLAVVRHHPSWREPYSGLVPMVLRDIAKDLTRYLLESEQAPSAVGLSIEHAEDGTVAAAAGFLIQAMPGAGDGALAELEANVKTLPRAAALVAGGERAQQLIERLGGSIEFGKAHSEHPVFFCPCDRDRAARALRMLEADELREIADSGLSQEVACQFCGRAYELGPDELRALL